MNHPIKKALIIGATSGIGREVALQLAAEGWHIGAVGRREERLISLQHQIQTSYSNRADYITADVTQEDSTMRIAQLVDKMGGIDLFFLSSGIGFQNVRLDVTLELQTITTNCQGFARMVTWAFHYFQSQDPTLKASGRRGHIAVISSIAGTKGLGAAPAYSSSKRFQNHYMECLTQLSHMKHLSIDFTDIRPGFVATDLLSGGHYPLLMKPSAVAHDIVRALKKRRRIVTIDWRYRLLVFFWRLIPRFLWIRLPISTQKEKN